MFANNNTHPPAISVPVPGTPVPSDLTKEDVALRDLAVGAKVEVQTRRHVYQIENCGGGMVLIAGHPRYCPKPVLVDLIGSSGTDSSYRIRAILRGASLEFVHPVHGFVRTSPITEIREIESPDCDVPAAKVS